MKTETKTLSLNDVGAGFAFSNESAVTPDRVKRWTAFNLDNKSDGDGPTVVAAFAALESLSQPYDTYLYG